jgi:D-alanyl-D-alanine carboxypeptidase (penicillin-binding protein 5/6)
MLFAFSIGTFKNKERFTLYRKLPLYISFLFSFSIFLTYTLLCASALHASEKRDYESAILMEASTGRILIEDNIHKKWPPASMTKMMLMFIVMEEIKSGRVSLEDEITVSADASRIGGSQVYLKEGEVFTLEELMKAIAIHSANDACQAVAEHIAGSAEGFIELMNEYAKILNLKDTEYHSIHGLPPSKGEEQDVTSAYDSAILARKLITYPKILEWTSTEETSFRDGKFILRNTNKLIGTFPGADGLKTGYTSKAGYNLTATAEREGVRFISVVMGAPTERARINESKRLLSIGFKLFQKKVMLKKDEVYPEEILIPNGRPDSIKPVAAQDLIVFVKRTELNKVQIELKPYPSLQAPIEKGQEIGEIIAKVAGENVGSVAAVTPEKIHEAGFLYKLYKKIVK